MRNAWPRRAVHASVAFLLVLALASATRADDEPNFVLDLPSGWVRQPKDPRWAKLGIVYGARRVLERLRSGETPTGEGGLVEVAVTTAPEGKGLDDLAADPAVRTFLLGRFEEPPPEVDVVPVPYDDGFALRVLTANGHARNLKSVVAPARGVLILALARGELTKLRMYAFHTEFDEEQLKGDLDEIESSFDILDKSQPKKDAPPPKRPDEPTDVIDGDEGEEVPMEDRIAGWKLVKPVGIRSKPDADTKKHADTKAWFEDSDARGSYQVVFTVLRNDRRVNGVQAAAVDLKAWGLDAWWKEFDRYHRRGPVRTWAWGRKAKTLLAFPDFEKERVIFESPEKRPAKPEEVDAKRLMKKPFACVHEVKNRPLGKERTQDAYRGALGGSAEHGGREIQLRYVWKTERLTCYLSVSLVGEARSKWGDGIAALLASIEMTGRPGKR